MPSTRPYPGTTSATGNEHAVDAPPVVPTVCVVGPGRRFLSGITYHTYLLADALSTHTTTSVIFLRQLLPTRLYPGASRVGADLTHLRLAPAVARFDGIDWFWLPSLLRAVWFLHRQRPDVVVLQWWTSTALHTYVALSLVARALGASIVVELHEIVDVGEAERPVVRWYSKLAGPLLFRRADRIIVHSGADRESMGRHYRLPPERIDVVPLPAVSTFRHGEVRRPCPAESHNLLYFGVIRSYKGVVDLLDAYESLPDDVAEQLWLTVVGEVWEGYTLPAERIARSPRRDRITFVDRFIPDEEVDAWFGGADAVVLPYRRSSMSGPLHVAMSYGLPVITTAVGGLPEAVVGYDGALLVPPADPSSLAAALEKVISLRGERFLAPDHRRDPAAGTLRTVSLAHAQHSKTRTA